MPRTVLLPICACALLLLILAMPASAGAAGAGDLDVQASDDWMDPGAVRYKTDGTLDASFGAGGIARPSVPAWTWIGSGALQADGKILMGGEGGEDGLLVRLTRPAPSMRCPR